jgi:hypothetical protein
MAVSWRFRARSSLAALIVPVVLATLITGDRAASAAPAAGVAPAAKAASVAAAGPRESGQLAGVVDKATGAAVYNPQKRLVQRRLRQQP